jgi:hypothetical protein
LNDEAILLAFIIDFYFCVININDDKCNLRKSFEILSQQKKKEEDNTKNVILCFLMTNKSISLSRVKKKSSLNA